MVFHVVGDTFVSHRKHAEHVRERAASLRDGTIFFHGPSSDVPALLRAADIYVCASTSEASPLSVWEAMAMGLAVVSTDVGDVASFVEPNAGAVVPIGAPGELARAVEELANDPGRRKRSGIAARRVAIENLDVRICAEKHADMYRSIIEARPDR
jgi:glycosyltransferase involved in cell wall biosynthesis